MVAHAQQIVSRVPLQGAATWWMSRNDPRAIGRLFW